ncbi:PE-PGRS family protein [Streptomyces lividans 1326]|uniref:PE-PGRS family protein n=1 Tax=Streptomyces lividans 1326 TaxID=1200984 RepID=A0A7U9HC09_STRLI|nr:PE-PGRS family protein [Streptomyces lividans 1326]
MARCRAVLHDQRLRHLHEFVGAQRLPLLHLARDPALPRLLAGHRRHHRRRVLHAGRHHPAALARPPGQPDHAATAHGGRRGRGRVLDPLGGDALLPALRAGRVAGCDVPARGRLLLRVGDRRGGGEAGRGQSDQRSGDGAGLLVLHRRAGLLPHVPLRAEPAAVGHDRLLLRDGQLHGDGDLAGDAGQRRTQRPRLGRGGRAHGLLRDDGGRGPGLVPPGRLALAAHRRGAHLSPVPPARVHRLGGVPPLPVHRQPVGPGRRDADGGPGALLPGAPVGGEAHVQAPQDRPDQGLRPDPGRGGHASRAAPDARRAGAAGARSAGLGTTGLGTAATRIRT